jgi:AcrR family transcriptional regulator
MAITPKPRGRHHHGDLRRALLDAVAEIVLEAGPDAVTLRECARRAGVSHSAATPHFGDKRGLLTAFATERSERLRASMEAAVAALPPGADAQAVLAATGHGYLAFARDSPAHFRLMFRTDLIDTTDPAWRQAATCARLPLDRAMAALLPTADGRTLRSRLALAWAAVHGFCALRTELPGSPFWTPEVAEDLIGLLVRACALPDAGSNPSN